VITGRDEAKLRAAADELGPDATATCVDAAESDKLNAFFHGLGALDHLVLAVGGTASAGPIASLDLANLRAGSRASSGRTSPPSRRRFRSRGLTDRLRS
jgi:NADP-dependent 3-hydroxy acid dehydrogenase YdfG